MSYSLIHAFNNTNYSHSFITFMLAKHLWENKAFKYHPTNKLITWEGETPKMVLSTLKNHIQGLYQITKVKRPARTLRLSYPIISYNHTQLCLYLRLPPYIQSIYTLLYCEQTFNESWNMLYESSFESLRIYGTKIFVVFSPFGQTSNLLTGS